MKKTIDLHALFLKKKAKALEAAKERKRLADGDRLFKKTHEKTEENKKTYVHAERRKFLDMVGKSGIASGMIRSSSLLGGVMAARHVSANELSKMRVLYCYYNSGCADGYWLPSGVDSMNSVTQPYGEVMASGGQSVASLSHFREINVIQTGHSRVMGALGCPQFTETQTMDMRLAPLLSTVAPYSSIYLATDHSARKCSNIGPSIGTPQRALETYFTAPNPDAGEDLTYKKSFEAQFAEIEKLRSKLSQQELARLEVHTEALQKISDRVESVMSNTGPDKTQFTPTLPPEASYSGNIAEQGKLQADIIIAAFQANLTNVGVLQLGDESGAWQTEGLATDYNSHAAAHQLGGIPSGGYREEFHNHPFNQTARWINQVPAYVIKRLTEEVDLDGIPLIERTVFAQVTCMGNGMSHNPGNSPFILATKHPGFKQGFSAANAGDCYDFNGAIPRGLGIPDSNYATMGDESGIDMLS